MKAIHGTAIYTGGGFYVVIGELDNGLYFHGNNDFLEILNDDPRQLDDAGELVCYDADWSEKHCADNTVDIKEAYAMFEDFCRRLDAGEAGLTQGYEKFSNYLAGEVTEAIDFSGFDL